MATLQELGRYAINNGIAEGEQIDSITFIRTVSLTERPEIIFDTYEVIAYDQSELVIRWMLIPTNYSYANWYEAQIELDAILTNNADKDGSLIQAITASVKEGLIDA